MNNATKLPIYEARAIFSEHRLKNTLIPRREGMTGEEGETSLAGLGVKTPCLGCPSPVLACSWKGVILSIFMILPNSHHLIIAILKQLCMFFPAESSNFGAT